MDTNAVPSGRRTGATWVAGTGAFLLLAAAATFIAVRWGTLPEAAKLALVGALTGGFLLGGRALARTLPATGDVLYHLGALLLPVDVAGLAVRGQWGWRWLLLAEGLVGVVALGALARARSGSVVLRVASAASMPVLAAGVAGLTPVPVAVVLIVLTVAADALGRLGIAGALAGVSPSEATGWRRAAAGWAALAGLAPLVGVVLVAVTRPGAWTGTYLGAGTLTDLGLLGRPLALTAGATGLVAAWVLGRRARERTDPALAFLALGCVATGAVASVVTPGITAGTGMVAAAAAFLGLELAAWLAGRDPFWGPVVRSVAGVAEAVVSIPTVVTAGGFVALAAVLGFIGDLASWSGSAALALGITAAAWLAADLRHAVTGSAGAGSLLSTLVRGGGREGFFVLAATSAVGAVVAATASPVAATVALVVTAGAAVASGRMAAPGVAAAAVVWAVVVAFPDPGWSLAAGLAGAAVLVEASRLGRRNQDLQRVAGPLGVFELLAVGSVIVALAGAGLGVDLVGPGTAAVVAVAACWLLALRLEMGTGAAPTSGSTADVARLGMLVPLVVLAGRGALAGAELVSVTGEVFRSTVHQALPAAASIPAAVAAVGLFAFDAARRRRPLLGFGAAVAVQLLLAEVARAAGLDHAGIGLTLAAGAIAWSGLAAVVEDPWRPPFFAAAGAGLGLGAVAASGDPATFSSVILIAGGLLAAAGLVSRRALAGHAGGILIALGIGGHLLTAGVAAPEPYVVPLAAQLVVAGAQARRGGRGGSRPAVSSWVAYGPAIALLGGVAVAERLGGGPGWHALVAGAVGVAAVVAGGAWRLAGPLVLGTGLLVAVTLHESLTALAGVPTWAWLAAGGSFLLVMGVALERSDTSPVEAGRRVVDVLSERFA
jgi:hypothetical protein